MRRPKIKFLSEFTPLQLLHLLESSICQSLIVLGETSIKYIDDNANDVITRNLDEATVFVAWEKFRVITSLALSSIYLIEVSPSTISPPNGAGIGIRKVDSQRWLLADDYGRLFFLSFILNNMGEIDDWKLA
jgi:DNA damage-binding protein 1